MHPINLRLSVVFLISVLLFPQSAGVIKGCGGYEMDDIVNTSLFIPQMIKENRFDPFFLSLEDYYYSGSSDQPGRVETDSRSLKDYNLDEWSAFFQGFIRSEDIENIVYQIEINAVDSVRQIIDKQIASTGISQKTKEAGELVKSGLVYLKFAKQIEKAVYRNYWMWDAEPPDQMELLEYRNRAITAYKTNKNTFLKMRYAFQYVRLCYETAAFNEGISFVENDFPFQASQGMMYFRTIGYQAACLVKKREFSRSNLIYARLYDLGEVFKYEAFESFHPQGETEWKTTLELAKSNREKEVLWHLMGVYADPLKGIHEIAQIDVNSNLLPLLLVRAVQIAELNSANTSVDEYSYEMLNPENRQFETFTPDPLYSWNSIFKEQIGELISELLLIAPKRQTDKGIWYMGISYLYWLQKDTENCRKYSEIAAREAQENSYVLLQHGINKLLIGYGETSVLNEKTENDLHGLFAQVNSNQNNTEANGNAMRFVLRGLREMYLKSGDELMAELAEPHPEIYYTNEAKIQDMIDFMNDSKISPFRRFLLSRYCFSVDDLYDVQATSKIYSYNFESALAIYEAHPNAGRVELAGNPFNFRKVDCHDCDHAMPQKVVYTKKSFLEKMIELKSKAENASLEAEERANNYFLFANGLYNMTYYGNARIVSSTVLDFEVMYENYNADKTQEQEIFPYHDCQLSEINYLKAAALSSKREFQARCFWMAAKCEHNVWLEKEYDEESGVDFIAGKYYHLLRDKYSNTKYYNEIIEECGYFCQYNNPGELSCIRNQ